MEVLAYIFSWGSPLGISLFFCFSGIGAGAFFWGIGQLSKAKQDSKSE